MSETSKDIRERLKQEPVLVAEGYIFELERRGYLKAGPFVPQVVLDDPDTVRALHREFARAGSDVIVACTYYAHRAKLKVIGMEDALQELNVAALKVAGEVAAEYDLMVAGNLSNTWEYRPGDAASAKTVRGIFEEQAGWAADHGADFIIAETFGHLGEARLALEAVKDVGLPAVITFSPATGRCCDGPTWEAACKALEDEGAAVTGLNCGNGPATMLPELKKIRAAVKGAVAGLPVPFRTTAEYPCFQKLSHPEFGDAFPTALDPFLLTRYEMADFTTKARDLGVGYIGICCGAGPHHVRAMSEALGRRPPAAEYSPDMELHPILGTRDIKSDHVECLFGPVAETSRGTADGK